MPANRKPVPAKPKPDPLRAAAMATLLMLDAMETADAIRLPYIGYHKTKNALLEALKR